MTSKYSVVNVNWKSAGFNIAVLRINEDDINDKLALLSNGSGVLSKIEHGDFLIKNCLADLEKVVGFLSSISLPQDNMEKAVEELISLIVRVNPLLDPELLVINDNNVIKVPGPEDLDARKLNKNPGWETDLLTPDTNNNLAPLFCDPTIMGGSFSGLGYDSDNPDEINAEAYMWDNIGTMVYIKKLSKSEGYKLLAKTLPLKSIDSEKRFKAVVVARYVVNYGKLLVFLDNKISTIEAMDKLYGFCVETNHYLNYETIDKDKLKKLKLKIDQQTLGIAPSKTKQKGKPKTTKEEPKEAPLLIDLEDVDEKDILTLGDRLKKRVLGQDTIIDSITESIQIARSKLKNPETPIGCYMLCGRTGTGKTYTAKILSEELCKTTSPIRIDCSEFTQPHDVAKLTGCFLPNIKVTMSDGSVKSINKIKKGDAVLSHKGKKRKVLKTFEYDYSGEIITFKVKGEAYIVKCTPNHEILVSADSSKDLHKAKWIKASEVKTGDIVYFPARQNETTLDATYEEILLYLNEKGIDETFCLNMGRLLTGKSLVTTDYNEKDMVATIDQHFNDLNHWFSFLPSGYVLEFLEGAFSKENTEITTEIRIYTDSIIELITDSLTKYGISCDTKLELMGLRSVITIKEKDRYYISEAKKAPIASLVKSVVKPVIKTGKFHYTGKIYDLKVDKDASYQIRGMAVHNSPPGYVGYGDGGMLTNKIKENPMSVVLFDEIEKANSKLHDMLLQILDEGRLTSGKGETVFFNNSIILMTSNIGVKSVDSISSTIGFGDVATITEKRKNKAIKEAVKLKFKPEFINRLDEILVFHQLDEKTCRDILTLNIDLLNEWLVESKTKLELSKKAFNFIVEKSFSPEYGARLLKRYLRKHVIKPVALKILRKEIKKTVLVDIKGNELVFTSKK